MNKEKMWVHVRDSFWFLPAVYGLISLAAVSLVSVADFLLVPKFEKNIPSVFLTNKSVAQTLYGSLITSILTMTTISFSTIMVVLTTYTTQFSPRTLQDFMRSRFTQHVLGVYSFGFIFSLVNLLLLGKEQSKGLISPFLTVIISIICLAFFILFIHHSSQFVKVNNLIGQIRLSTSKIIKKTFEEKDYEESSVWDQEEVDHIRSANRRVIYAEQSGYVQGVQIKPLMAWAKENDVLLEADFFIGHYIQKGMPIFYYIQNNESDEFSPEYCLQFLLIGNERTDIQDIEFSIQKLVEIAVKSISPSINDPHTAVNCINRIGSLLAELGQQFIPIRYYADHNQDLRLILEPKPYREYLYKSFYQIRIYGRHDLSVMNGVLEALYKIAVVDGAEVRKDVWRFGEYMIKAVDVEELEELDYEYFHQQAKKLANACGEPLDYLA
ncbi:DUF2254 domain-containing protein [Halobacillus salinarum]|uniref:DUF2254 domain-containing protein n=1 Tax=Halobacillus salinarum TaxID=2932257 RepID=A0ABY4EIS6_9BACI|nr:DUF2254 domain-containing protein [Halobacillus salinarum]UOQ44380.1 DUF2254 domain-containing protein [Halobacillus salinarum]